MKFALAIASVLVGSFVLVLLGAFLAATLTGCSSSPEPFEPEHLYFPAWTPQLIVEPPPDWPRTTLDPKPGPVIIVPAPGTEYPYPVETRKPVERKK